MSFPKHLTELGRLSFATPLLVRGQFDTVLNRLSEYGLNLGAPVEVSCLSRLDEASAWYEFRASGADVTGMFNDAEGLVAEADEIVAAFGPFFHQAVVLAILGQRFEANAVINSRTIISRVGANLTCALYRERGELNTGRRFVLMNQGAGNTAGFANVIPLAKPRHFGGSSSNDA